MTSNHHHPITSSSSPPQPTQYYFAPPCIRGTKVTNDPRGLLRPPAPYVSQHMWRHIRGQCANRRNPPCAQHQVANYIMPTAVLHPTNIPISIIISFNHRPTQHHAHATFPASLYMYRLGACLKLTAANSTNDLNTHISLTPGCFVPQQGRGAGERVSKSQYIPPCTTQSHTSLCHCHQT